MNYYLHCTSIPSLLFPVRSVSLHSLKIMNKFHFLRALLQNEFSWKFTNIQRKTTVLESLFNKAAGQTACHFIKRRVQRRFFLWNLWNFQEHLCFTKQLRWMLLYFSSKWLYIFSQIYFNFQVVKWISV